MDSSVKLSVVAPQSSAPLILEGQGMDRLRQCRENLDAVIQALASLELSSGSRSHLLQLLRNRRTDLSRCLVDLGWAGQPPVDAARRHFQRLDAVARTHLATILGVPQRPPYDEVLDAKAEEYLCQVRVFEAVTEADGFRERSRLNRRARCGAVVLTLSGSLVQLSGASRAGGRRYLYQNIYGNTHPPEGELVLDRDVRIGHRVRSVELTTSPVRLLRVARRRMSWRAQQRTFDKLFRSLGALSRRASAPKLQLRARATAASTEQALQREYAEGFSQFARLREGLVDSDLAQADAEALTCCHYLQNAARSLGFSAWSFGDVGEFVTREGKTYRIDAARRVVVRLPTPSSPEVLYSGVTVGRQQVTCCAPLALIGSDGGVLELIPAIAVIRRV